MRKSEPARESLVHRSGRPSALRRSAPLRTGRARFRAPGSSKPRRLVGGRKCRAAAGVAAAGVYETGFLLVGRAVAGDDLDERLSGGHQPPFPFVGVLWSVAIGQQCVSADRALTVLGFQ